MDEPSAEPVGRTHQGQAKALRRYRRAFRVSRTSCCDRYLALFAPATAPARFFFGLLLNPTSSSNGVNARSA